MRMIRRAPRIRTRDLRAIHFQVGFVITFRRILPCLCGFRVFAEIVRCQMQRGYFLVSLNKESLKHSAFVGKNAFIAHDNAVFFYDVK